MTTPADDLRTRATDWATSHGEGSLGDPAWIAAARTMVPELLAELDRVTAERDYLRAINTDAVAASVWQQSEIERLRDLAVALEAENPALRAKLAELETELSYRRGRPPA